MYMCTYIHIHMCICIYIYICIHKHSYMFAGPILLCPSIRQAILRAFRARRVRTTGSGGEMRHGVTSDIGRYECFARDI